MGRLAQTEGLTEFEQDILATVRDFTAREIIPVATVFAALAGSLVLAAITGAIRAMTVRVWIQGGQALRQGTWITALLWIVSLPTRFAPSPSSSPPSALLRLLWGWLSSASASHSWPRPITKVVLLRSQTLIFTRALWLASSSSLVDYS